MKKIKFLVDKASSYLHREELFDERCVHFKWAMRMNGRRYAHLEEKDRPEIIREEQYIELTPEEVLEFVNKHGRCVISPINIETSSFPGEKLGRILIYDSYIE